ALARRRSGYLPKILVEPAGVGESDAVAGVQDSFASRKPVNGLTHTETVLIVERSQPEIRLELPRQVRMGDTEHTSDFSYQNGRCEGLCDETFRLLRQRRGIHVFQRHVRPWFSNQCDEFVRCSSKRNRFQIEHHRGHQPVTRWSRGSREANKMSVQNAIDLREIRNDGKRCPEKNTRMPVLC